MMKKISKIDPHLRIMFWGFVIAIICKNVEFANTSFEIFAVYLLVTIHFYSTKTFNRQQSRRSLESKIFKVVSYLEFLRKKENTAIQVIAVTDEILKLLGEEAQEIIEAIALEYQEAGEGQEPTPIIKEVESEVIEPNPEDPKAKKKKTTKKKKEKPKK